MTFYQVEYNHELIGAINLPPKASETVDRGRSVLVPSYADIPDAQIRSLSTFNPNNIWFTPKIWITGIHSVILLTPEKIDRVEKIIGFYPLRPYLIPEWYFNNRSSI